jgi:hypothetical protein
MTCTITQADLGAQFADVDPDMADMFIECAMEIVLGPEPLQAGTEALWIGCSLAPCRAVKLLAQHLLAVTPGTGAEDGKTITAERVGDVSVTYANADSNSGLFSGSPYGSMYALMLGKYETCRGRRRTAPIAFGGRGGCACR